jgi:hypothetical protein
MLGRKTETKLKKNLKPKFGNDALENADLGKNLPDLVGRRGFCLRNFCRGSWKGFSLKRFEIKFF